MASYKGVTENGKTSFKNRGLLDDIVKGNLNSKRGKKIARKTKNRTVEIKA